MSKSIYEEALEDLKRLIEQAQKQEAEHIEYSKKVQEQFSNDTKRIGELESKLIKQDNLLELYKELIILYQQLLFQLEIGESKNNTNYYKSEIIKLRKQIKELEK